MTRRWLAAAIVVVGLMAPAAVRAHDGHLHTYRGTVSAITDGQLEIQTTDGKALVFVRNAQTVYRRGKTTVAPATIEVGERVVVGALAPGGGKPMTARTVQLPVLSASR